MRADQHPLQIVFVASSLFFSSAACAGVSGPDADLPVAAPPEGAGDEGDGELPDPGPPVEEAPDDDEPADWAAAIQGTDAAMRPATSSVMDERAMKSSALLNGYVRAQVAVTAMRPIAGRVLPLFGRRPGLAPGAASSPPVLRHDRWSPSVRRGPEQKEHLMYEIWASEENPSMRLIKKQGAPFAAPRSLRDWSLLGVADVTGGIAETVEREGFDEVTSGAPFDPAAVFGAAEDAVPGPRDPQ